LLVIGINIYMAAVAVFKFIKTQKESHQNENKKWLFQEGLLNTRVSAATLSKKTSNNNKSYANAIK